MLSIDYRGEYNICCYQVRDAVTQQGQKTDSYQGASSERSADNSAIKLAMISSGLGNTTRGFETSTARWFQALRKHTKLDVRLFCGGKFPEGKQLWNMPRNSFWTKPARSMPFISEQHRWEFTYGVEQISFWSALNFELLAWRPDVVWIKDFPLVHLVKLSRTVFGLKFKLIFANGGLPDPNAYKEFDFIQQIQGRGYEEAIDAGIPRERMEILTNCVPVTRQPVDRLRVRKSLGLSESDWVIVCIAAWNKYHKRIDYLLDEVGRITDPAVRLVLCGAPEVETKSLQEQGRRLLGDRVQWLTVDIDEVPPIIKASDVLALPTLQEHLGNALIEAAMCGIPVVTHPHDGARFTIQDEFWFTDLSEPGNLTSRLLWLRHNAADLPQRLAKLQAEVTARFGDETQAVRFEEMVLKALSS